MSAKDYNVLRPTVAHIAVALVHYAPQPVLVESKDKQRYGKIPINEYLRFQAKGLLP